MNHCYWRAIFSFSWCAPDIEQSHSVSSATMPVVCLSYKFYRLQKSWKTLIKKPLRTKEILSCLMRFGWIEKSRSYFLKHYKSTWYDVRLIYGYLHFPNAETTDKLNLQTLLQCGRSIWLGPQKRPRINDLGFRLKKKGGGQTQNVQYRADMGLCDDSWVFLISHMQMECPKCLRG